MEHADIYHRMADPHLAPVSKYKHGGVAFLVHEEWGTLGLRSGRWERRCCRGRRGSINMIRRLSGVHMGDGVVGCFGGICAAGIKSCSYGAPVLAPYTRTIMVLGIINIHPQISGRRANRASRTLSMKQ